MYLVKVDSFSIPPMYWNYRHVVLGPVWCSPRDSLQDFMKQVPIKLCLQPIMWSICHIMGWRQSLSSYFLHLFIYVSVLPVWIYFMHVHSICGSQKTGPVPWNWRLGWLWATMWMGVGNLTWVLCKRWPTLWAISLAPLCVILILRML